MKLYIPSSQSLVIQSPVSRSSARLGLSDVQRHVAPATALYSENVLLPLRAGESRQRYGFVLYLVSACGRKAVPILCRRSWAQAMLAATSDGCASPLWQEVNAGLRLAEARLAESVFTLDGAVECARRWFRAQGATLQSSEAQGCVVITGHGAAHALCADAHVGQVQGMAPPKVIASAPQVRHCGQRMAA